MFFIRKHCNLVKSSQTLSMPHFSKEPYITLRFLTCCRSILISASWGSSCPCRPVLCGASLCEREAPAAAAAAGGGRAWGSSEHSDPLPPKVSYITHANRTSPRTTPPRLSDYVTGARSYVSVPSRASGSVTAAAALLSHSQLRGLQAVRSVLSHRPQKPISNVIKP